MTAPGPRKHRHRFAPRRGAPFWAKGWSAWLLSLAGVRTRPFFQWTGFTAGGTVFAALPRSLRSDDILVRLAPAQRRRLLEAGRARPYVRGSKSAWIRLSRRQAASGLRRILRLAHAEARGKGQT